MPSKNKKSSYSLLRQLFYGSRLLYFAAFVFMVLSVICNFLMPQLVRFVADNLFENDASANHAIPVVQQLLRLVGCSTLNTANMPRVGFLVVFIAIMGGVFQFTYKKSLSVGAEGIIKRLRDRLYKHIQYLPYEWHIRIQTGDIIQRCTADVEIVRNFLANQMMEMLRTLILVTCAYVLLFPMNFTMAMASFLFLPIIFVYSFVFMRMTSNRFLLADEADGLLLSVAQENFTGVRVVRAFGRERHEVDRFDRQNLHSLNSWVRVGNLLSTYWGVGDLIAGLQMITICVLGVFQAIDGNISVGEFIVFLSYNSMTIWPVRGLGRILSEASKMQVSLERIGDILNTEPETDLPTATDAPDGGTIEFNDVSFAYESNGKEVLSHVSFVAEQGKTLGILGATGSGKTTIAHLLCRLYDLGENNGKITIGGININNIKRQSLRSKVGIVMQEPFLYSRTIRENIASLAPENNLDDIREAAMVACLDSSIEEFANSYDTIVGERGVTLSGGQKQRVAIARTVLANPPIMIFDDSLSAVDTETDAHIREALLARTKNVTTVIIAHRVTSISRADHVIVMDNGKIIEAGAPDELMAQNGVYRHIHDMQEATEETINAEVSK